MATSRNRYKTQRSVIDANGIARSKEFVQRKDESKRSVDQRANKWQVDMRGKMPSQDMALELAVRIHLEYRKADLDEGIIGPDTYRADQTDALNLLQVFGADREQAKKFLKPIEGEEEVLSLGTPKISQIDTYRIDLALRPLAKKKARTAKGLREYGRRLYNWIVAKKWSDENPFVDSRAIAYDPEKFEEPMTPEEFDESLAKVSRQDIKTMLALLRWTALRPKGARELLWSELEERNGRLFARKQKAKRTSGTRPVFIPEPAASMIRAMPRTSLFVFPSTKTGRPYDHSFLASQWRKVRPNDRGVYDLKHLRVSELSEIFDDTGTAVAAGMKSMQALSNYRQFSPDKIAEAIERSEQSRNTQKRKHAN
jgi:integrase